MPLIFVPFASSGAFTDRRTAKVIVGNALNGDTAADCDFLDPGDGSGIAAAIAALPAEADLFLRAGTYDLSLGAETGPFVLAGVRCWAAGATLRGTVIVMRDDDANQTAFQLTDRGELHDVLIQVPVPQVATAGFGFVDVGADSLVERVVMGLNGSAYAPLDFPNQGVLFGFFLGDGADAGAANAILNDCAVEDAPRFWDEAGAPPATPFACYGSTDIPGLELSGATLHDCRCENGDIAVNMDGTAGAGGQRIKIQGFVGTGMAVNGILINEIGECMIQGAFLLLNNPSGQQPGFAAVRVLTDAADINNHNFHAIHTSFIGVGQGGPAGSAVRYDVVGIGSIEDSVLTGCTIELNWDVGVELSAGTGRIIVVANVTHAGAAASVVDNGVGNEVAHNL
jgi:hypothetical protein